MVYWKWNEIGRLIRPKYPDYPIHIYEGTNCLFAMTTETLDGERFSFVGFADDWQHLAKMLGLRKNYEGKKENIFEGYDVGSVVLYVDSGFPAKDILILSQKFSSAGYDVTLTKRDK